MKKMEWMLLLLLLGSGVGTVVLAQQPDDCTPTPKDDLHVQTFESKIFGDTQTLRVWLPPGYDDPANAKRVYSVLYMMDGGGNFSGCKDGHVSGWQIDRTLTRLIAAGSVEPIIVVAIDSGKGKGRRAEEYVPFVVHDGGPNVQGDLFPDFMVKEVLPLIAAAYRVSPKREHRGIGGSSYGSVAALNTLIQRPDAFGLGLLESTSLQVGNGKMLDRTKSLKQGPVRVSIGVGDVEAGKDSPTSINFAKFSKELAANMEAAKNHPKVLFTETPGGKHDQKSWGARFPAAVQFVFPATSPQ